MRLMCLFFIAYLAVTTEEFICAVIDDTPQEIEYVEDEPEQPLGTIVLDAVVVLQDGQELDITLTE